VRDAESVSDLAGPRLHERQQSIDDLQIVIDSDRFLPRPANPAVPKLRRLLGSVGTLQPWLMHHQHAIGMRLRPADQAMEMVLEIPQHDRWVGHGREHLFGFRAHASSGDEPCPGALLHVDTTKPRSAQPASDLRQGPRAGLPAEALLRMTGKQHFLWHRRSRPRRRGTLLEPVIYVAGPDHDDDRIEVAVLGEDVLENDIELGRPDP